MIDDTEQLRRAMLEAGVPERHLAEASKVWDTDALRAEFAVIGFAAPFVVVRRLSDRKLGSMEFTHLPRFYFNFVEDSNAAAE